MTTEEFNYGMTEYYTTRKAFLCSIGKDQVGLEEPIITNGVKNHPIFDEAIKFEFGDGEEQYVIWKVFNSEEEAITWLEKISVPLPDTCLGGLVKEKSKRMLWYRFSEPAEFSNYLYR